MSFVTAPGLHVAPTSQSIPRRSAVDRPRTPEYDASPPPASSITCRSVPAKAARNRRVSEGVVDDAVLTAEASATRVTEHWKFQEPVRKARSRNTLDTRNRAVASRRARGSLRMKSCRCGVAVNSSGSSSGNRKQPSWREQPRPDDPQPLPQREACRHAGKFEALAARCRQATLDNAVPGPPRACRPRRWRRERAVRSGAVMNSRTSASSRE